MRRTARLLEPGTEASHLTAQHEKILILDFGAQYTQLIARRVREAKVYCEIHPCDVTDAFVRGFGATPSTMPAAEHDRLLAYLSHLPQLAVSALMEVVGHAATERGLVHAGQGLIDSTRLASSPASVWR